jgi:hypothetical protein
MRGVILSGILVAAMGCATVGKVGVNTDTYQTWWQDCGVSRPVPGNIALFKGQLTSPHAALIAPEEMPPKTSNVKGVMLLVLSKPRYAPIIETKRKQMITIANIKYEDLG